jgi:hypothetical protein
MGLRERSFGCITASNRFSREPVLAPAAAGLSRNPIAASRRFDRRGE